MDIRTRSTSYEQGQAMIPITPRTCKHLTDWCRMYQSGGTVPQPPHIRFSIGFYQISQGMAWKIENPVRRQSFCAAAMHFVMCAEAFGIGLEPTLPETLSEIPDSWNSWEHLLFTLGKAQQQVVYSPAISKGSTRESIFSPATLQVYLYEAVAQCFSLVPPEAREEGCFAEMKILTGDLPERKP